jgi:ubiquinone/menaquinone biosynthesis C-methylase UbiE
VRRNRIASPPTRSETRQWYDRLSRWYDWVSSPWEGPFRRMGLQALDLQEGERVLELGPGTGHGLVTLARAAGSSGLVCGLDLSPGMLSVAGQRLRKHSLSADISLVVGDAGDLPFHEGSFDALFASFVLELFEPQELPFLLAGCRAVLRPGGRLCAVSLSAGGRSFFMRRVYQWAQRRWPRLIDCRPIHLAQSLGQAGFALLSRSHRSSLDLPVEIVVAVRG